MEILDVRQGSDEWVEARLGIPTASEFDRLITPTGKPASGQAVDKFMHELLAEYLIGGAVNDYQSQYMERGSRLEQQAVSYYEILNDVKTRAVGFCRTDDGKAGCSPDRLLVGSDNGVEIKCPSAPVHVGYMLGIPHKKYKPQIQGSIWICEAEYWDFISYNPSLPPETHRYERDDDYIKVLEEIVLGFNERLDAAKEQMAQHRVLRIERKEPPARPNILVTDDVTNEQEEQLYGAA